MLIWKLSNVRIVLASSRDFGNMGTSPNRGLANKKHFVWIRREENNSHATFRETRWDFKLKHGKDFNFQRDQESQDPHFLCSWLALNLRIVSKNRETRSIGKPKSNSSFFFDTHWLVIQRENEINLTIRDSQKRVNDAFLNISVPGIFFRH